MASIDVSIVIDATRQQVWAHAADLASHVEWMADAESIEFEPGPLSGTGTIMRVATRVGPLRTIDIIEVVDWVEEDRIGVRHRGIVSGHGSFTLAPHEQGIVFTWSETLKFPWYLGGPITAASAKRPLRWVWRRNLKRFRQRVESDRSTTGL